MPRAHYIHRAPHAPERPVMSVATFTNAVRSLGRVKSVASVFMKHGYGDVVRRLKLPLPTNRVTEAPGKRGSAERLRMALEELGPAFVKLGQTLSMRPDLLPPEFIDELRLLQDQVPPVPYPEVVQALEEALGGPPDVLFHSFDEEPIAAASIGQVHSATILDDHGNLLDVVVKIRRPGIRRIVDQDLRVVSLLAEALVNYVPESRALNPKGLVDEFFKTIRKELDFREEMNSLKVIAKNFEDQQDFLVIPTVYEGLSCESVLTMDRLKGTPLSDTDRIRSLPCDLKQVAERGAGCILDMVFNHGVFHGDLHAGNLFIFDEGKIGLIDFGIVGHLNPRTREQVADLLLTLVNGDYRRSARLYAELGDRIDPEVAPDLDAFASALSATWEPSRNRPLGEIKVGELLLDGSSAGARSGIMLPQDLLLLFKALLTLESMGRSLDPDFDVSGVARAYIETLFAQRFDPNRLQKDFLGASLDLYHLTRDGPTLLLDLMKRLGDGAMRHDVQVKHLDQLTQSLDNSANRLAGGVMVGGMAIASAILIASSQSPLITAFGVVVGAFGTTVGFYMLYKVLRSWWRAE
ncbi:MAG TPA: hypothetical protein DEB46_09430 [Myxococcales bacterium]|nr:hypothetical protein [Myxococcales bacterium]